MEELESNIQELSFRELNAIMDLKNCRIGRDPGIFTTGSGSYTNLALILSDQCPWTAEIASYGLHLRSVEGSVSKQGSELPDLLLRMRRDLYRKQGDLGKIPARSISEAVLDAIVRRDYRVADPIGIDIRPRSIIISYPSTEPCRTRAGNPNLLEVMRILEHDVPTAIGMGGIMTPFRSC